MGRKRTLEEQLADHEAKAARVRAKVALKNLTSIPTGKRLLSAMRSLAWIVKQADAEEGPVPKVAAEALSLITAALAKAYKVEPADLAPGTADEAELDHPSLPGFEGEKAAG